MPRGAVTVLARPGTEIRRARSGDLDGLVACTAAAEKLVHRLCGI